MMLRKLLLPLMLAVLGTAPAVAAPRGPVKPAAKSKKATAKPVVKATPAKKKGPAAPPPKGRRVATRAGKLVGASLSAYRVPDDCSGLVRAAYQAVGIELLSHGTLPGENAVSAIHRRAQRAGALHKRTPKPGDIVFFRETYDRNRDGKRNDGMTHIAVVETVELDGTVTFIHRGSKGIARSRMNLLFPRTHRAGQSGPILNDFLRAASKGQRAWLTGELFVGFASPSTL